MKRKLLSNDDLLHFDHYHRHQCLYPNYKLLSQSICDNMNGCKTEIILCSWKDCLWSCFLPKHDNCSLYKWQRKHRFECCDFIKGLIDTDKLLSFRNKIAWVFEWRLRSFDDFDVQLYLKLQSVSFASLSPSLFENLELQLCAELSSVCWVVLWHGSSVDESNVLSSMCVSLSVTAPVWILYLGITASSLRLRIYDWNKNFHRILSSETSK